MKMKSIVKYMILGMMFIMLPLSVVSCDTFPSSESSLSEEWDNLGGGGEGEVQSSADTGDIDDIVSKGDEIVEDIEDDQTNIDYGDV